MKREICDNCRFYYQGPEALGHCRRFPPQTVWQTFQTGRGRHDDRWPSVEKLEWCGEWREIEK